MTHSKALEALEKLLKEEIEVRIFVLKRDKSKDVSGYDFRIENLKKEIKIFNKSLLQEKPIYIKPGYYAFKGMILIKKTFSLNGSHWPQWYIKNGSDVVVNGRETKIKAVEYFNRWGVN